MAKSSQHREKHHPLIEEMRADVMHLYVEMLRRLNYSIADELKRARGFAKGHALFVIDGGKRAIASQSGIDLIKHVPASSDDTIEKSKKPYGHTAYTRHTKDGKVVHVDARGVKPMEADEDEEPAAKKDSKASTKRGAKDEEAKAPKAPKTDVQLQQGAWFADENGNVRFALGPTGRYKRQLSDEETQSLYKDLNVVVGDVIGSRADQLADFMDVDLDVVGSLKEAVQLAQSRGLAVEDVFVQDFVEGIDDEDEDGMPLDDAAKREMAHNVYSDMMASFKEATESDDWKKYSQKLVAKQQRDAQAAAETAKKQQKIIGGFFDDLMSGDLKAENAKMLGVMHSLGFFDIPENLAQAKKYADSDAQAYKMIGKARVNVDRYNAVAKTAPTLSIDQQSAIIAMNLVAGEQDLLEEDPIANVESYWGDDHPALDALRRWQKDSGREFSDAEWDKVKERVTESAHGIADMLRQYNENPAQAIIFRALSHGQTNVEKLFKNPKETERLQQMQEELETKMRRAVDAQSKHDVEIDPIIEKALKAQDPNGGLFNFQKSAIGWMQEIDAGILAYGAGMGKTPMATTYVSNLIRQGKEKRGVMTVPATLVDQWASEISRFRPGSKVLTLTGSLEERRMLLEAVNRGDIEADFIVMPDSTLEGLTDDSNAELEERIKDHKKKFPGKGVGPVERANILADSGILDRDPMVQALKNLEGACIFDEAHMIGLKESANIRHIVTREMLSTKTHKFGMTATPMTKGPEDLFTLMNLFNPGSAGESLSQFTNRFVQFNKSTDDEGNEQVEVALHDLKDLQAAKASIAPFVYFRSKIEKDVIDEMESKGRKLPKINPVSHPLNLPDEARDVYERAAEVGFDEDVEPYGGRGDKLTDSQQMGKMLERGDSEFAMKRVMATRGYIRQLQAAVSPKLVDKNYNGPQPKIDAMVELVQRHFAMPENSDRPVVVFGNYKNSLALAQEAMAKAGMPSHLMATYTGDVNSQDRAAIQNAVNEGKIKVVFIGIQAGGTGLNLQKASNRMVFLDKPWTPAQIEQSVGRVWRTGNPYDQVHVHHMGISGTTDDDKLAKNINRISFSDALSVADKGEEAISSKVMESIKVLVGSMDKKMEDWTPEQKKELLTSAGLSASDELPNFMQMPALREQVDFKKFTDAVKESNFKKFGDVRVNRLAALNDARLKSGSITKEEHAKEKKRIAKIAKNWTEVVDQSQHQYVAKYLEDFDWKSGDTGSTLGDRSKGMKKPLAKTSVKPKGVKPYPLESAAGSIKMHDKAKFTLVGADKNPFPKVTPQWTFWEALRRTKPDGYKDAVSKVGDWVYQHYQGSDNEMTREQTKAAVKKWFEQKKILHKFAKQGLIKVTA